MKLKTVNSKGKYRDSDAKEDVISYILRGDKTPEEYKGGVMVDFSNPADSMKAVSKKFGKESGVQLRHFIMTFSPEELSDANKVNEIGKKISRYVGEDFQNVYAVHTDRPHLHIHIVSNSVSYIDGHRYYGTKKEFHEFKTSLKKIVGEYGINKVEYVSNKK